MFNKSKKRAILCLTLLITTYEGLSIMAANALVTTRIDGQIKAEAALVLSAMGLSISDAVRLLLTKIAREHALPFEPFTPNAETIEAMLEARRGGLEGFDTIDELMVALHAQD